MARHEWCRSASTGTGRSFVIGTSPQTPKFEALRANPAVALTIDTNVTPQHVLLVRGTATVEIVDGVFDDYIESARRLVPDEMFAEWERPSGRCTTAWCASRSRRTGRS